MALIAFLLVPGSVTAYVTHSAIWIVVAPITFVVLMIVFAYETGSHWSPAGPSG